MEKYTREDLEKMRIHEIRDILRNMNGTPRMDKKEDLINTILGIQSGDIAADGHRERRGRPPFEIKDDQVGSEEKEQSGRFSFHSDGERLDSIDEMARGILDILSEGFGFLRPTDYKLNGKDIFVSPAMIRSWKLKKGDFVIGSVGQQRDKGAPALTSIYSVNGKQNLSARVDFDDLTPHYPDERLTLETPDNGNDLSVRCIDLLCPIGKGQRGLIVAPPKAGKTTLLKKIAEYLTCNYPSAYLMVLLIDERPEEVTDIRESVDCDVIASTFDESAENHVRVSELALQRAKRLVENGEDVIILLDSITRLARAYNNVTPTSGKTLTGGLDPAAMQGPKRFFGAARNIKNGGSLTIIATALIETGSKMDDVIYEEFKGTGNMEIHLTSELSEKRVFPAIDLYKSGTRKEELLLSEKELDCAYRLRKILSTDKNASENLLDMMSKTANNGDFVEKLPTWIRLSEGKG